MRVWRVLVVGACLCLALLAVPPVAQAGGGDVLWTRQFGTSGTDYGSGVAVDGSGVYVAGHVTGALPGQTFAGGEDVFVRKYDLAGNQVWTSQFGTSGNDEARAVAVDGTGVYVGGHTWGALPGETHAGDADVFVCRYDLAGKRVWTRQFGTWSYDYGLGVAVDGSGVYVAGYSSGVLPGQTIGGVFVRKYDLAGNEVWTRSVGTTTDYEGSLAVDGSAVYVVGGLRSGALPGQTPAGGEDAFVRKYDLAGNEVWTRQFGTTEADSGRAVAVAGSGVYVTGYTAGTFPGQTFAGGYGDVFVRKFDLAGNEVWTRQFGTASWDAGEGVAVDSSGVYVAGTGGPAVPGQESDAFVRKYDLAGNEVWTRQIRTDLGDNGYGVAADGSNLYVTGMTWGNLGGTAAGGIDAFVRAYLADGPPPGGFGKTSPANGATELPANPTLVWGAALGADSYDYCYDTSDDSACTGNWTSTGSTSSAALPSLAPDTTYYWQVRAKNGFGTTYADGGIWWSFTTGGPSSTPNDDFGGAAAIGALPHTTTQYVGWATTAADDPGFPCALGFSRFRSVWYRYTAPDANTLTADTFGSTYDTLIGVWTGSRGSLTSVACNDDSGSPQSLVQFTPSAGTTYYIEVASFDPAPAGSQLTFHVRAVPSAFGKAAPADGAVGQPFSPSLSWGASSGATSYEYCYDPSDNDSCQGGWESTGTATSVSLPNVGTNTFFWQVRANNALGTTYADGGAWWGFTTLATATFRSEGGYDGWVLEQDETSGKGGTFDATATTARVGDDASDRQYRSVLHFDTSSLPDSAVIIGVTVRIKKQSMVGTNPFDTHGFLTVDVKSGAFHDNPELEKYDFQAAGSRGNVGRFVKTPALGWFRAPLRAAAYPLINLAGSTQLRLRFSLDDNDDLGADYLSFYTGNAPEADRPELIVTYYVP